MKINKFLEKRLYVPKQNVVFYKNCFVQYEYMENLMPERVIPDFNINDWVFKYDYAPWL